jgi:DNA-3-methyladenine glycosylase
MKLAEEFYIQKEVVILAKALLGKRLCTNIDGRLTTGIITETEAYAGETDKASHAYGGKRTARTEMMYAKGGVAYVYLCYGIHSLFNVVTNVEDLPHAVLIRAIKPQDGMETMLDRSGKTKLRKADSIGPGKISKLLGIHFKNNGESLLADRIWIEETDIQIKDSDITVSKRIGIDYAEEDADLPYRFVLKQ